VCCNDLVQFNAYTAAGAHIAVWLVNHPSPEAPALAAVLDRYDVHQPMTTAGQVRALRPWAERLRRVFEAGTVAEKAESADALLVAADCRPRLVSHGAGLAFHLHYAPVRTGLAARVRALTAAGWRTSSTARAVPGCGPAAGPDAAWSSSTPRATGAATSAASGAPTRST